MLRFTFYSVLFSFAVAVVAVGGVLWYMLPQLPSVDALRDIRLQTPLRVYTADGRLIAEFGEKRRDPVAIEVVPERMKQAFIAAEDDRYYEHPGVDWIAIVRAAYELLHTREKKQGGSTITMQVARNFYLSPEKTYERKLKEVMLAVKIERDLSKDEILELYLNKIFLGHRAYGIGAAARVYYGKDLQDLTLAQIAMIAGLPKAPSSTNPVTNPKAALDRRAYVLGRMLKLRFIDQPAYDEAVNSPITARLHGHEVETSAPYIAEMVRKFMQERYQDEIYTSGFQVYTTISSRLQEGADGAVRRALLDYDRRHGYRGPEHHFEIPPQAGEVEWSKLLETYIVIGGLRPALVVGLTDQEAQIFVPDQGLQSIPWAGLKWARKYINHDYTGGTPKTANDILKIGDVVRVEWLSPEPVESDKQNEQPQQGVVPVAGGYWRLTEIPSVEGALVSIDSSNGAIRALVGGFDFNKSKFNRVTQAQRQPGSNFKPFIYSAALEHGFTAASFINDAPIVFDAPGLENAWRPENYSGKYYGPTRLRNALAKSRNLVSIRLTRAIGVKAVLDYVQRFGFDTSRLPANLSLSLGSGELTPLEVVSGYAVFSNGGYRVEPYFVERIEAANGDLIMKTQPATVCADCKEPDLDDEGEPADLAAVIEQSETAGRHPAKLVIDPRNAWIMNSMLQGVIKYGTGRRALQLKRSDLAGKTGTTNDQKDAWFSGFNGRIATTAWAGFDQSTPLGRMETGARAALPMWMEYMGLALDGMAEAQMERPPGLVSVRIDPNTGLLSGVDNPNAIFESFREESVPKRRSGTNRQTFDQGTDRGLSEQLF